MFPSKKSFNELNAFSQQQYFSHCVANSLLDIAKYISKDFKKFVLLEDAVSSVDGFEYLSEIFLDRAFDLGIRVMKTTDMRVFFND